MSVRRLSPNQPESFAFKPETLKEVKRWIDNYPPGKQQSAVIPLLWLVQKQEGWVSEPAIRAVADLLKMPVSTIYELARRGKLPARRLGRTWRFLRPRLEQLLAT